MQNYSNNQQNPSKNKIRSKNRIVPKVIVIQLSTQHREDTLAYQQDSKKCKACSSNRSPFV